MTAADPGSRTLARAFASMLAAKGYDFYTGVPCSLLKDLILELEASSVYYPETREDAAIGLCAGAWMAGKKPCVLMQNSGLGVCLNALTSLSMMYEIPALIVMSYRGRGPDAPEHKLMGAVCETLLGTIGVPRRVLAPDNLQDALFWAEAWLSEKSTPACLLVPPGLFDGGGHS
ncbi:MAG: thiamine pyrophosphate-binding protein [Acidobacteriota bacterium]